ncbi:MAG: acyl-CoA dehydrogenase [Mariprofundales bacterium]
MLYLLLWIGVIFGVLCAIDRLRLSLIQWMAATASLLLLLTVSGMLCGWPALLAWVVFLSMACVFNLSSLRQRLLSNPAYDFVHKALPPMSETERQAVEAGNVWWEAELFSGKPDWQKLIQLTPNNLSDVEQNFLDDEVEVLCSMLDDWQITHELNDLPAEVWTFIRDKGFFGLIIPTEYGGKGFSALAHSAVIMKLASRSDTAAVDVMVPNSLGPAELLFKHGTDKQKDYYLPLLASGKEIPCFALTAPLAGSDAGAMPDTGIVCRGTYNDEEALGLRLNWDKRYITLAPIATVLGLAFKTFDPEHLLGDDGVEDLGISCALIPTDTAGISIGARHYPLNTAFLNGPTQGKDVFIPLSFIIGGRSGIGQGWKMLMESLATGRGISLPSLGTAAGKLCTRTSGAYCRVRKQFHLPIGKFAGVQESLARIAGLTYLSDAGRLLMLQGLDAGEHPAVMSAMLKYKNTEILRQVLNDAMDVHGGRGIMMGASNYIGSHYQAVPVAITVEGANILTRCVIIFGQGAMRCHPFVQQEIILASKQDDASRNTFDTVLLEHIACTITNMTRAVLFGISHRFAKSPVSGSEAIEAVYYQKLARISAIFAAMSDVALLTLGGKLKRYESISGRFADAFSAMFMCSAVLKHFANQGRQKADAPLLHWACQYSLHEAEQALYAISRNYPLSWLRWWLRLNLFPLGRRNAPPADIYNSQLAELMMTPSSARDRLTAGIYVPDDADDITGKLEHALQTTLQAEPILQRLQKQGFEVFAQSDFSSCVQQWQDGEHITAAEAEIITIAHAAMLAAITVDVFEPVSQ